MDALAKIREAIRNSGRHFVMATVESVDLGQLSAVVKFETESILRESVPLRILNNDSGMGSVLVPKIGSEVMIGFIDGAESRPGVIKVQEWTHQIARKTSQDSGAFESIIDDQNNISIKRGDRFQLAIEGDTHIKIKSGSAYEIDIDENGKVKLTTQDDLRVECVNAAIAASGNIDLGEGGSGVLTHQLLPVCMVTGAPIPFSATVKAKA